MNPNYNKDPKNNDNKIQQNETPEKHALHVWKNYVRDSGFKNILILAHSAGGFCLS